MGVRLNCCRDLKLFLQMKTGFRTVQGACPAGGCLAPSAPPPVSSGHHHDPAIPLGKEELQRVVMLGWLAWPNDRSRPNDSLGDCHAVSGCFTARFPQHLAVKASYCGAGGFAIAGW